MQPPAFAGLWRDDDRARAAYSEGAGIYRIIPRAVAIPSTTAAVVTLVRWAAANRVPLVPRGAGSGMPGHNVGEGVILDLTSLDGAPLRIDPDRREATTGAAVRLATLDDYAGRHGLRMPVDPSSVRFATVGGAVATNASGSRTVKYGPVRRWVSGLTLVTAQGSIVHLERGRDAVEDDRWLPGASELNRTLRQARWRVAASFPKLRKNTAGYGLDQYCESGDLIDLLIGAEGTLGIVTDVTWRLEPVPRHRRGVRAAVRDCRRLGALVPDLLELGPSRIEFLDASFLAFVSDAVRALPRGDRLAAGAALLLIEMEGDDLATLERSVERAVGIVRADSADVEVGRELAEVDALWAIRHAASSKLARLGDSLRSLQVIEDASLPIAKLGEYLIAVRAVSEQRRIPVVMFGHAGDGNVHANLLPDITRDGWEAGVRAVFEDVARLVIALGGSPSGEHGDGRLRAGLLRSVYHPEVVELFWRVKHLFDPLGILNPGVKLAADGATPFEHLKVGAAARPLPPDIEAGLRRIERDGGYSTGRLQLADDPLTPGA
jgi:FAD/FMN-containing dehydrogenase